jgi:hypothetical protein
MCEVYLLKDITRSFKLSLNASLLRASHWHVQFIHHAAFAVVSGLQMRKQARRMSVENDLAGRVGECVVPRAKARLRPLEPSWIVRSVTPLFQAQRWLATADNRLRCQCSAIFL